MFNKLCRIGNTPEIRHTPNGDAVLNLSLAYSYGRKGEDGKRPTQWLDASLWGKQAEAVQQYLKKGDQISVSVDDLHIETYPKKDGTEGFKLAGRVASFDFVSAKREEQAEAKPVAQAAPAKAGAFDNFDDESIPF